MWPLFSYNTYYYAAAAAAAAIVTKNRFAIFAGFWFWRVTVCPDGQKN